ncbi:MAG: hypothetical protein RLZZ383_2865 [Pseudomonadota bacterium]|jgi:hypothetical protein
MRRALLVLCLAACGRPTTRRHAASTPEDGDDVTAMLEAIGYAAGTEAATGEGGVDRNDGERVQPGANLVVSGHAPEAVLLDAQGTTLATWRLPEEAARGLRRKFFRKAWLLDGGDLLAIAEGQAMFRLGPDGTLRWRSDLDHHHDAALVGDRIHALTRAPELHRDLRRDGVVLEDRITVMTLDGRVEREVSILDAIRAADDRGWYRQLRDAGRDITHTNSIVLLDGQAPAKHPAFVAGSYLLSSRTLSVVFVLDPMLGKVTWWAQGPWRRQHDARQLPSGDVQMFDNQAPAGPSLVRVMDPATGETVRTIDGAARGGFFSKTCGTAKPLANGNLLVVSSNMGEAFELAADGAVVWSWRSPWRVPGRPDLIASVFDVTRTPLPPWIADRPAAGTPNGP